MIIPKTLCVFCSLSQKLAADFLLIAIRDELIITLVLMMVKDSS